MATPDATDPYAQMAHAQQMAAQAQMAQMYQMYSMDPTLAAQYPHMMMGQDPAMMHMQHQQQMMAMQHAQMNPMMGMPPIPMDPGTSGFNNRGLPLRPGVQPCQYFLKTGECKYGPECKWDHSDGTSTGMMTHVIPPQAPLPGAIGVTQNSLGYPLRPGQQPCSYFSKTGTCSFGASCKWDHPEEYCQLAVNHPQGPPPIPSGAPVVVATPEGFNAQGYPIRPNQEPCTYYLKFGTCSFGFNCRWDHPEGRGGSQPNFKKADTQPKAVTRAAPY